MKYLIFTFLILFSAHSYACTITWNTSEENVRQAMKKGIEVFDGWTFKKYDEVCNRLQRNNAKLHISGQFWEESPNSHIYSYSVAIADKRSSLTSPNYIRQGMSFILREDIQQVQLHFFKQLNKIIDTWHDEGVFDQSVKFFHKSKMQIRDNK